jgi:hypothetical protein
LNLFGYGQITMAGYIECDEENLHSIKRLAFLDQISDDWLLQNSVS